MIRDFNQPAIDEVRAFQAGARDRFMICDIPGLHEVASKLPHGIGASGTVAKLQTGDMSLVRLADRYMHEMEQHVFVSRKFTTINDVCGAVPNIPNYLAGIPEAMRRRKRTNAPAGPLVIISEQAPSGSVSSDQMAKRGAAVLALVQLLANKRPVELWTAMTLGKHGEFNSILCKMETAPLDLARVAFMLCDDPITRHVGYTLIHERMQTGATGFAYGTPELERRFAAKAWGRAIDASAQVAYITFMHAHDDALNDPVAWIKHNLAQYAGETYEAA